VQKKKNKKQKGGGVSLLDLHEKVQQRIKGINDLNKEKSLAKIKELSGKQKK